MDEPSIQYGATNSGPTQRQVAQQAAKELGIDPKGLTTREIKAAVSDKQKINDDMSAFIKNVINNIPKNVNVNPPDQPVTTTTRPEDPPSNFVAAGNRSRRGGGSSTTSFPKPYSFAGSYNPDTGVLTIGKGSYEYPLGTNVDVQATSGTGDYAYAIIKQNAGGGLVEFKTEASASTKDPTNRDAADEYVEFSNVLLGEVMTIPDPEGGPDTYTFIQRRTGNLSLIRRIINGSFCLWPETTGGSSL
jgi:hypothetical protein